MTRRLEADGGFTLVELMTVILVIAVLVTIAIPVYSSARSTARERTCLATRTIVERADYAFYVASGRRPTGIAELVGTYVKDTPRCPAEGVYAWVYEADSTAPARTLGCSVHYFPSAPLTPLGSSFTEISTNMIKLITDYYSEHGSWPRSWSPYNYTDLGLDPAFWAKPVEHLVYSASGSRMSIRPETGYKVVVTNAAGQTYTLTAELKWNIWYSALDGKWYYHTITPGQQIVISSMVVSPK
jgi:prepilin-type N-terminal cleavage/methylation domain-containing protein